MQIKDFTDKTTVHNGRAYRVNTKKNHEHLLMSMPGFVQSLLSDSYVLDWVWAWGCNHVTQIL